MSTSEKPRWHYRFDNYKRAFSLLREAIEVSQERELSQLEKEGVIQRFEYTMELAWKTMKDYMEDQGVVFAEPLPRIVIKQATAANLVEDGQAWLDALDARNRMSHTYDFKKFEAVIEDIRQRYLAVFDALYMFLMEKLI